MDYLHEPLAIDISTDQGWSDHDPTLAIMPIIHPAHDHTLLAVQTTQPDPSTLQQTSNQPPDLRSLLNAIPSTIHVENLALSVQSNTVNNGPDVASMRAYIE
jgi:hypothetical protein